MMQVIVPLWNSLGIIPPVDLSNTTSRLRSPYSVSIVELITIFCRTQDRCNLLKGFLNFRSDIHESGLTEGFQWLDGSFFENIELTEKRSPRDIDVITFFKLPEGQNQKDIKSKNSNAFNSQYQKEHNFVDSQFVSLERNAEELVGNATYWYSIWSHRRDFLWKGFFQVDLNPQLDSDAREMIDSYQMTGT